MFKDLFATIGHLAKIGEETAAQMEMDEYGRIFPFANAVGIGSLNTPDNKTQNNNLPAQVGFEDFINAYLDYGWDDIEKDSINRDKIGNYWSLSAPTESAPTPRLLQKFWSHGFDGLAWVRT